MINKLEAIITFASFFIKNEKIHNIAKNPILSLNYKTSFYPIISSWNEEWKSYLAPNLLNLYLGKETILNKLLKALKVEPVTNLTYNTKKK